MLKKLYNKLRSLQTGKVHSAFPKMVHPIQYPSGETEESLLNYLQGFRLDGATGNELDNYLAQDFKRFVYTLNLLPKQQQGSLLEIGANPYFTSILLETYSQYSLFFTNYFGIEGGVSKQVQENKAANKVFEFEYANHNIDESALPFDEKFDVVLFCEVLEHLINDPMQALLRIKASMVDNGVLILTTPNVNRLENIAKMIVGSNIYDPYSGYGIYGRHNREYNKHELSLLLSHCGFEIEEMFTSDVHFNHSDSIFPVNKLAQHIADISYRDLDLGQYIFVRARNVAPAKECKPSWLFRSYPEAELCD